MLSRNAAYLICASLSSVPSTLPAHDLDPPEGDEIILNAWSNPADCSRSVATRASFSTLAAESEDLIGECVEVEGYWSGRALFGSIRDTKVPRSNSIDRPQGKRIGIYAQWEKVGEPPEKPARVTFVGRVGQCETQWPGAMMVMGYCHYTGGPILLVAEAFSN